MSDRPTTDVAFSSAVKAEQTARGSRRNYERVEQKGGWAVEVDDNLAGFIATRDSFYLATASAEGQPYIQHRGGPAGFLKVLGPTTLAFADFAGNQQYISLGNLSENDRVQLFLMDYANRQRIKIWGRAKVVEGDVDLLAKLVDPGYRARPERAILIEISAWDVNCPQHITPRFTEQDLKPVVQELTERIAMLESELDSLKAKTA